MACPSLRIALLVGAVTAVTVVPARAQDPKGGPEPKAPEAKPRMVTITECVEEPYEVRRTCYRQECRRVEYDTFRCETVCEPRERVCTVTRKIPCYHTEMRQVCCKQYHYEDRVCMKKCYEYVHTTKCVKKCVSKGHWECREECCKPSCFQRLCHRNDCCEPCCTTRTRKVWVHCPVYVDCVVPCCQKVCVEKPCVTKVRVCCNVMKEVPVQVCTYKCVQEQCVQRYYVRTCRQVPCKAVRCETVCVPYEEVVRCCRCVARTREVPADSPEAAAHLATPCCVPCCVPCCDSCGGGHHGAGLRFRGHHSCY